MIKEEPVVQSSIIKRLHRIHERMQLERMTGVSPVNRDLFLAMCRDLENGEIASSWITDDKTDSNELCWEPFDNWNNAPDFLVKRER